MGASRKTSLSSLLIGLGAAGCMPHGGNAPSASAPATPVLTKPALEQAAVPLTDDGSGANERAVFEAVNNQGDRISEIIRKREEAKVLAADIREQREASAQARGEQARSEEATGEGDASSRMTPEALEALAAKIRENAKREKPAVDAAIENPPADGTIDSWEKTELSAAQTPENGDFGDASPLRRSVIQGSVADQTQVQPIQPGPLPSVGRAQSTAPGIDPLLAIQEQFLSRVNDKPKDLAAQLELQLARLLRNEPVPAMADLSALSGEDRELLAAVSDALANFRNLVRNDPNPLGAEKARPFVEMADRIRSRTDLSVASVNLCSTVRAFGNYDPVEPLQFAAGSPTLSVFYCEVDGFLSQLNEKQLWESKLSLELRLYNEAGMQLWRVAPETVLDTSRKRRRDFFIAKRIQLPPKLSPGAYMLKATVRDLNANRVAESTLQLSVVSK